MFVFPPPCFAVERQDLKADDLKQNCAAAYAGTCQACIQCTAALRIGAPENGVIRNYASSLSGLEACHYGRALESKFWDDSHHYSGHPFFNEQFLEIVIFKNIIEFPPMALFEYIMPYIYISISKQMFMVVIWVYCGLPWKTGCFKMPQLVTQFPNSSWDTVICREQALAPASEFLKKGLSGKYILVCTCPNGQAGLWAIYIFPIENGTST